MKDDFLNKIIKHNVVNRFPLPDKCISTCVTSPPYWGLRDYGTASWEGGNESCNHFIKGDGVSAGDKQKTNVGSMRTAKSTCPSCGAMRVDEQLGLEDTPEEYISNMVSVFREVKRVLRDDGTIWINIGDSYVTSPPGNTKKSDTDIDGVYHRKTTRQLGHGEDKNNIYKKPDGLKNKDLVGIPWMLAFALRADGWYLRQDIIWHKPNSMPESVTDRCTKSHEYIFLLSKSNKYYFDIEAIREKAIYVGVSGMDNSGYKDAKLYNGKHKNLEIAGKKNNTFHEDRLRGKQYQSETRNKRSVWTVATKPFPDAHFATFPPDLIVDCIKAGSPVGGVVLDLFMGAGTTGMVAKKLGRNFTGLELKQEYIDIANRRIDEEVYHIVTKKDGTKIKLNQLF